MHEYEREKETRPLSLSILLAHTASIQNIGVVKMFSGGSDAFMCVVRFIAVI